MRICSSWGRLAAAFVLAGLLAAPASAVETEWSFDNNTLAPKSTNHPITTMTFLLDTETAVTFGTASSYGLPAMPGGNATAMHFDGFTPSRGLAVYDIAPPNGTLPDMTPALKVNSYTMAWDILITDVAGMPNSIGDPDNSFMSFFQTLPDNSNDGDFFLREDGGIGISGNYDGAIQSNTWTRVVLSIDPVGHFFNKYIDGVLVEAQAHANADFDLRWALFPDGSANDPPFADFFLLADEDNETTDGYISNFYFTDHVVDSETIAAWGGADADGIVPDVKPGDVNFDGVVNIFDINFVSSNWNGTGPAGDANHDGIVNIFDINLISSNWTPTGATAVPEPATVGLLLVGAALVGIGRKRFGTKNV